MLYEAGTYPNEAEVQAQAAVLVKKYKDKWLTSFDDFKGFEGITCPHCGIVISDHEEWTNGAYLNSIHYDTNFPFQKVIECTCGKKYLIAVKEENLFIEGKRQGGTR